MKSHSRKLAEVFRIYDLKKKLLIHFILIVLAMITMSTQYIYEAGNKRTLREISALAGQENAVGIEEILNSRKTRTAAVAGGCFLFAMCVIAAFIRNVVGPLNEIAGATRRMTDGDLSATAPAETGDEIGEIGNRINDLSANLQEILLEVWNGSVHSRRLIDEIDNSIRSKPCNCISPELRNEIDFVRQHTEDIQAIIQTFDLYDVHLEDNKVHSGPQPDVEWD